MAKCIVEGCIVRSGEKKGLNSSHMSQNYRLPAYMDTPRAQNQLNSHDHVKH